MESIELKDILLIYRKRWWVVVVIAVISTLASALISFYFLEPTYQSNTTLYIINNADTQSTVAYNDLLAGERLVKDCRELVKSRLVSNTVRDELGLKDITTDQLANKLSVNLKTDTRVLQISAQDSDPVMAQRIANKAAQVFQKNAVEIMRVENVTIIDRAEVAENPIKPNKRLNIAIALILGIMVGTGLIFLIEYLDDTIKTPEDIEKYTGLPVIGTIPVFPE